LEILKDEFKILTGRTFSRNKMARKLSVFSSLMSNYTFNNNFWQKIIIFWKVYKKLYVDIQFIWKYWRMNSNSWQDGLFHGTKWRQNYQCSCVWSRIIVLTLTSVKRWLYIWKACKKVMSKNVSKFARPVFLRPVFRPTRRRSHLKSKKEKRKKK
jgi:hypothetical protein